MQYEDHSMAFEDSLPVAMDLDSFRFGDHVDDSDEGGGGGGGLTDFPMVLSSGGGGGGGGYDANLPRFPRFDDAEFSALVKPSDRRGDETFGGEKQLPAASGDIQDGTEQEQHRVTSYTGSSVEGICHSIVVEAGYAGLESPLRLRQLVSQAIAAGPLVEEKRRTPAAQFTTTDGFARAFVALSIAAYAQPSALVVNLPEDRYLVLLASGSEMVLVDPREQPASSKTKAAAPLRVEQGFVHGLPRLPQLDSLLDAASDNSSSSKGALVMRSRSHLEISDYILSHYKTHPSGARLYVLKDPQQTVAAEVAAAATTSAAAAASGKDSNSSEVTKSVAALSLGPLSSPTRSTAETQQPVPANPKLWQTGVASKRLSDLYKNAPTDAIRENPSVDAWGGVIANPVTVTAVAAVVVPEKNTEGKRERTPPSPPAMGSPVRMASDDEGAEKSKRAKTPPLAPVAESPVAVAVAVATPIQAPAPVVTAASNRTERRKSAPKTPRTSGSSVAVVPVAAGSTAPKKTAPAATEAAATSK